MTPQRIAVDLYQNGWTLKRIAQHLEIEKTEVAELLKNAFANKNDGRITRSGVPANQGPVDQGLNVKGLLKRKKDTAEHSGIIKGLRLAANIVGAYPDLHSLKLVRAIKAEADRLEKK